MIIRCRSSHDSDTTILRPDIIDTTVLGVSSANSISSQLMRNSSLFKRCTLITPFQSFPYFFAGTPALFYECPRRQTRQREDS
jgi:hypothetical protein